MKTSRLAIAVLAGAVTATLGASTRANATPGDPLPTCVSSVIGGTATSTTIFVKNNCATTQRVRVILNGRAQTLCTTLAPGTSKSLVTTPKANSVALVQC
jgi:hypothetical protein